MYSYVWNGFKNINTISYYKFTNYIFPINKYDVRIQQFKRVLVLWRYFIDRLTRKQICISNGRQIYWSLFFLVSVINNDVNFVLGAHNLCPIMILTKKKKSCEWKTGQTFVVSCTQSLRIAHMDKTMVKMSLNHHTEYFTSTNA